MLETNETLQHFKLSVLEVLMREYVLLFKKFHSSSREFKPRFQSSLVVHSLA